MSKPNKQNICAAVAATLLVAFAAYLRSMGRSVETEAGSFIIGILRGTIYTGLFSAWGLSVHYRIVQTQARRFLSGISALTVVWVLTRTLKYMFFSDTGVGRYLWYLYYFPLLFIPLIALMIALSLGKPEKFQFSSWTNFLFGVSVLFLLLVLTNDYHQLVFGFPYGLLHYDNGEYTHRLGYYLILCWVLLCAITAFACIVAKCRVPYSKRRILFPCIPLAMLVIYAILYLTAMDVIHPIAGDMTVVVCLLTAAIFEACIQCGLIQSNSHYPALFKCMSIHAKISDEEYNVFLSSVDTEPLSKDLLCQTEKAPVMLDNGVRLCSAPIKEGHVIWSEDVSEITEVIDELADSSEYLTSRRTVLHREVETRKEEQRLTEQNRLYNHLVNDNQAEYALFSDLLTQLEASNDEEQDKRLTAKLAVVCTHIKRRGNLLFLAESGEKINASELQFALEEWLSNLRLCGVKCGLYSGMHLTLTFPQIVSLYDTFQWVLLYTLDTLRNLLVTVGYRDGEPCLLLNLNCECDLSKASYPHVSISDEFDGEWVITISIPEGGASE